MLLNIRNRFPANCKLGFLQLIPTCMDDELCYISESTKLQFYMSIAEVQTYPKCRVNVQYCGKEENEAKKGFP